MQGVSSVFSKNCHCHVFVFFLVTSCLLMTLIKFCNDRMSLRIYCLKKVHISIWDISSILQLVAFYIRTLKCWIRAMPQFLDSTAGQSELLDCFILPCVVVNLFICIEFKFKSVSFCHYQRYSSFYFHPKVIDHL